MHNVPVSSLTDGNLDVRIVRLNAWRLALFRLASAVPSLQVVTVLLAAHTSLTRHSDGRLGCYLLTASECGSEGAEW